jgi:hypothetical protein
MTEPLKVGPRNPHVDVPHLAWPFRLDGSRFRQVEQDSLEDVTQAVHAVAVTPRGARPLAPDVGVDDPTFGPGIVPARLAADLEAAHPLAVVAVDVGEPDAAGVQQVTVHVDLAE